MLIPDYFEPIVGWRGWNVDAEGGLRGAARSELWVPGQPAVAVCANAGNKYQYGYNPQTKPNHLEVGVPQQACTCGFYAYKSLETELKQLLDSMDMEWDYGSRRLVPKPRVHATYIQQTLGQVNLWGRVIVHQRGYRAQYAYPKAIIVSESVGEQRIENIRKYYKIEVEVVPDITEFLRRLIMARGGIDE